MAAEHKHSPLVVLLAHWSDGIRLCLEEGAASGRMMAYACRNQAGGKGILGRWIDRKFLNYPGWEGVRRRRSSLENLITKAIDSIDAEEIHLLDIAGGTADYVLSALAQRRIRNVNAICLDIAGESIEEGQRRANEAGLTHVRFQQGDATDAASLLQITPRPDIVICSGFYELLTDDAIVQNSLATIARLLAPGGQLIVSHQVDRPGVGGAGQMFAGQSATMKMRPPQVFEPMLQSAGFMIQQTIFAAQLNAIFLARRI